MKLNSTIVRTIVFAAALTVNISCYGFDALQLDDKSPLFTIIDKSVPVVTSTYIGWAENWKWAGTKVKSNDLVKNDNALSAKYSAQVPQLALDFSGNVAQKNNRITWSYDWDKSSDYPNAIGFGIEFSFSLNAPTFEAPAKPPELLAGNQGWRWQTPDGESIEVKFYPALAKIALKEAGQKLAIRAFFFTSIKKGHERTSMTVTLTGKNSQIIKSTGLNYDAGPNDTWDRNILSETASPVDLTFLNANDMPAGKHGFVKSRLDQLVYEDGTLAKFWGTNLMAYALFKTSEADIKAHAKRIAQLGFNLVRIHHHDSVWVNPNIFVNPKDNTKELSAEAFKKLDWWIKCLKEEGVYIWLDMEVGRNFTKNDGIDDFEEMVGFKKHKIKTRGKTNDVAGSKGFNYYNESIQKQMQNFSRTYLTHVNAFTNLAYKDDPAIFALLLTNENDLTKHFGNIFLAKNTELPKHSAKFFDDVRQFSKANGLSEKKIAQPWEMGEPKIYLSDVEHRFNLKMLTQIRSLGVKSMLATTNSWGKMGLFGLPSLTDGDLIDSHAYGRAEEFNFNPRYNPSFLTWISEAQVTGKPHSITEWNMTRFPVEDRFTAPIYTASIANLQGWDALMLYGYSQMTLSLKSQGSNFSSYNDPAIIGLMPAAALLYRRGDVSPAKQSYELKLSRDDFYFKLQNPFTSKTIRTLLETSRLTVTVPETKELPWLKGNQQGLGNTIIVTDANKDFIPQSQDFVQSDTGELKRDWVKGFQTINTPKSQVASGWIGGETISLTDVTLKISTKKAVVAVQSLDDKDLKNSKRIFITTMARSVPDKDNKTEFLSEPIIGEIVVSAISGLKLYSVNGLGEKTKFVDNVYVKGQYHIKLNQANKSHWFILSAI